MSGRRVQRPISFIAEAVVPTAADAIDSFLRGKTCVYVRRRGAAILLLGAAAALLVGVALLLLFRTDVQRATASSTLKCYNSAGKHEPCLARASTSPPQSGGRTTEGDQPASWTATALYDQAGWAATATTTFDQPANGTTSAPAARRSSTSGKRSASAICRQRLLPCFFSALRRGLTRIASGAASMGRARSPGNS
jgi:hypothetical protein